MRACANGMLWVEGMGPAGAGNAIKASVQAVHRRSRAGQVGAAHLPRLKMAF
jgi:hypothetical protein